MKPGRERLLHIGLLHIIKDMWSGLPVRKVELTSFAKILHRNRHRAQLASYHCTTWLAGEHQLVGGEAMLEVGGHFVIGQAGVGMAVFRTRSPSSGATAMGRISARWA